MRNRRESRERTFGGVEPEGPDDEGTELALVWAAVDGVFVEAFADEGVEKVGETGSVIPSISSSMENQVQKVRRTSLPQWMHLSAR